MGESRMDENFSEDVDKARGQRRFHVELSGVQAFLCGLALLFSLSWMFVFGILVGRGLPLVDSRDVSLRAEFLQFLGLGQEDAHPAVENAAETWETPQKQQETQKKILESLNYYEDLAHKDTPASPGAPPDPHTTSGKDKAADRDQKAKVKQPSPAAQRPEGASPGSLKGASQSSPKEQDASENLSEHFTLLIASLKDADGARKLVDQLRAKGYNARLEPLDAGGANWNRVLLGSFPNRDGALRFAAEFNRRERMEGLVIRESR